MASTRPRRSAGWLKDTEASHGRFEETELKGVYDQDWPSWYAAYAVDHGIGELLGSPIRAEARGVPHDQQQGVERLQAQATETWIAYTARRIATEL